MLAKLMLHGLTQPAALRHEPEQLAQRGIEIGAIARLLGEERLHLQLAQALHARAPYLGIVVVSQYPSPEAARITSGLPPGAAFVHKGEVESSKVVLRAIESVLSDDLDPVRQTASVDPGAIARCSANQVELLRMIALGYSNERIARERGTGVRAVEQLIHRTYARLGLPGDSEANARVLAVRAYVTAFGMPTPER